MFSIYVFCFQSHNDVSNERLCFQSNFYVFNLFLCFQSTLFLKHIQNLHITVSNLHCFQCMFPINILPSIHCFPSTNVVSNLNSLFPSYFFVSYLIIMSTYYRSKYFWNVKMGFEQFRFAFSSLSKVKGKLMAFLKIFFLDFSKSVPAQKILLSTRFFCLIMLHYNVNRKNHHSEVYHLTKKIIRWVILS